MNTSFPSSPRIFLFLLFAWALSPSLSFAQTSDNTTTANNCNILSAVYTHYPTAIEKNRIMNHVISQSLDDKIQEWSLSFLYRGKRENNPQIFIDTSANLGLISSLDSTIAINNVNYTCSYLMTDFISSFGAKWGSDNSILGFSGYFDIGGFGFKDEIPQFLREVKSDYSFGVGGFFGLKAPYLLGGYYGSSLLLSSYTFSTNLGLAQDSLFLSENTGTLIRFNNYWAKNVTSGINAFHFRIGANIEAILNNPIKVTRQTAGTPNTPYNASNSLSIYTIEPAAAFHYTRAWALSNQDIIELTLKSDVSFSAASLQSDDFLFLNPAAEYVKGDAAALSIASFGTGLLFNVGSFIKRSFGNIDVTMGTKYRILSRGSTSSSELIFTGKASIVF